MGSSHAIRGGRGLLPAGTVGGGLAPARPRPRRRVWVPWRILGVLALLALLVLPLLARTRFPTTYPELLRVTAGTPAEVA